MYSWNLVVITLFGGTYFPFLWFIVMRTRAKEILVKNKFYEIDPTALVPTWAKTGTQIFFYAHYCFFLVPLTMFSWLHGLAAFGAGVLMFVFTPVFFRSDLIIFRRNILQVFKKDQVDGDNL